MNVKEFKKEAVRDIKNSSLPLDKSSQFKMISFNISTDTISAILSDIFNEYVKGISDSIIPPWRIYVIKGNINERLEDLQPYLSKNDYLSICLMIGTKIDNWVIEAVYEELYETASNLKKILYD